MSNHLYTLSDQTTRTKSNTRVAIQILGHGVVTGLGQRSLGRRLRMFLRTFSTEKCHIRFQTETSECQVTLLCSILVLRSSLTLPCYLYYQLLLINTGQWSHWGLLFQVLARASKEVIAGTRRSSCFRRGSFETKGGSAITHGCGHAHCYYYGIYRNC